MKWFLNVKVVWCGAQVHVAYSIAPSQAAEAEKLPVKARPEVLSSKRRKKNLESEKPSSLEDLRFLDDLDAMLRCVKRTRPSLD